MNSEVFF